MNKMSFNFNIKNLPKAANPDWVETGFERWKEVVTEKDNASLLAFSDMACVEGPIKPILDTIFGNSPFLTLCAHRDPEFTQNLLENGPETAINEVLNTLEEMRKQELDDAFISRTVRQARRKIALGVAVADITGIWTLEQVTKALSDFAEKAIRLVTAHLLRGLAKKGAFALPDLEEPEKGSGLIILGMGKLGAGELNYSSDIDLIILFDHERIKTDNLGGLQQHFVRFARNLVKLLEERTGDGYVFRTDLRLRPDAGATPLAISALAAETYYESIGQNWERAAMIKARQMAGDKEAGDLFLKNLRPFVWRRSMDFHAIQDIHAIKRQINAHKGHAKVALAGHNIKLGRGGIREIEFFAQTQQLIWGGRELDLRNRRTIETLNTLADTGRITPETAKEMIAAYRYLRGVEHRLQMVNDEQTQTLPESPETLDAFAVFMGYDNKDDFGKDLFYHLERVENHYARLFEDDEEVPATHTIEGSLVFTGGDSDPETLKTIQKMGFEKPEIVDQTVRAWHHARYRATRTTRSREILTEILPVILQELANTADPDQAFLKFDEFLSDLPSGVQLFSMFRSKPQLLELVAEIMGGAPRLAEHLSRRSTILDNVLTPGFFDALPTDEEMAEELDRYLDQTLSYEECLDYARRWTNDKKFQIGVQNIRGYITPRRAALGSSMIAETVVRALLKRVQDEFAIKHGRIDGGRFAILAMGKMGSREMTPASDMDLVFIYQVPEGDGIMSDGDKPLGPGQYYMRLGQRIINAITAPMAEGTLYEVDMRLRPAGDAGPLATSLNAFRQYYEKDAWTWEYMALTRARCIAGDDDFCGAVEAHVKEILTRERDNDKLLGDVADMRKRMDKEHHTDSPWKIKHYRGGMVDIEFTAQYLQLHHAHETPEVLSVSTRHALEMLREKDYLDPVMAADMIEALDLWQGLQCMLRLTLQESLQAESDDDVPEALQRILSRIGDSIDFTRLKDKIEGLSKRSFDIYQELVDIPAEQLPKPEQSE